MDHEDKRKGTATRADARSDPSPHNTRHVVDGRVTERLVSAPSSKVAAVKHGALESQSSPSTKYHHDDGRHCAEGSDPAPLEYSHGEYADDDAQHCNEPE
jgi:hypothetical protein